MKTVYIKRNDLFAKVPMILCNNISTADESFFGDNYNIYFAEPHGEDINEEIERLSQIDWSREEYKPYNITAEMSSDEIKEHLALYHKEDLENDLEDHGLEPYQMYLIDIDDYTKKRWEEFGVVVGYSDLLDCHVLPIYDFGTSWDAFSYSKEVEDDYQLCYNETTNRTTVY